jgi:rSAM/selenodomain-associated transferase 2
VISVIIPTLNAAPRLGACLGALVTAAADGLVVEVVLADAGSSDETLEIADAMGATVVSGAKGRGPQLIAGASQARRGTWLLFLHADTVLEPGWEAAARGFMERNTTKRAAAAFTLAYDNDTKQARRAERLIAWRCETFGLPYGDQGLLISRETYDRIGGFASLPLMEDVDIVRRLGRRHITLLRAKATTSADKYERDGWLKRSTKNLALVLAYYAGMKPETLAAWYR